MSDNAHHTSAAEALRSTLDGTVLMAEDTAFEESRVLFNAAIDTQPLMIARVAHTQDVVRALRLATERNIPIAVRSGGHNVAGSSLVEGGLVVDMRALNSATVDPRERTVTVGGGALWRDLDQAAHEHGLATTGGRVSTTGVAGLTLGGGSGWLERRFGLACDNLLGADVVTADGHVLSVDEDHHPDLFWALHGGGGNFGIATSMTFRLHPLPEFSMALLIWDEQDGEAVGRHYREFVEAASDDIGGGMLYITGPPEDFMPESLVDRLCCGVLVTFVGNADDLRRRIAPLRDLRPAAEMIADMPYMELQRMLDDPPGYRNYWSAEYLREFPDDAVRRFCACAQDMIVPSPSQHVVFPWGGAVARDRGHGPLANRDVPWVVHPLGLWTDPADDVRARDWAHRTRDELMQWSTGAVYLNFIGDEGIDRVVAGFGRENYERLGRIKVEYDPNNLFRRWHNVVPAAAT